MVLEGEWEAACIPAGRAGVELGEVLHWGLAVPCEADLRVGPCGVAKVED